MKRKGLLRFLSCALALMLPLSALAQSAAIDLLDQAKKDGKEIVTTLTFTPGETLAQDQIVSEMSAATAVRLSKMANGLGGLSISLQGVDVFTVLARVQVDGLYLQSETLGEKPLYFTWEDVKNYIASSMRSSGTSNAQVEQFTTGFGQALAGAFTANDTQPVTFDEKMIKDRITQTMGGDESFVKWMEEIEARAVVTSGDFTVGDSDKANTKSESVITGEDMAKLLDSEYIQKQMASQIRAQDTTLTDEQVAAKLKEMTDDQKKQLLDTNTVMNITLYTAGKTDNPELIAFVIDTVSTMTTPAIDTVAATDAIATTDVVATAETIATTDTATTTDGVAATDMATATATVQPAATAAPVQVKAHIQYTRQTVADGKNYAFILTTETDGKKTADVNGLLKIGDKAANGTLSVSDSKAQLFTMGLTADYADPKAIAGQLNLAVLDSTSPTAIVLDFAQKTSDTAIDTAISVSNAPTMDAIKADTTKALVGTLNVKTAIQDDSGLYTALKEVTPETSLALLKLSEADMTSYLGTLQSNGVKLLYKVLANLPEKTSKLFSTLVSGK